MAAWFEANKAFNHAVHAEAAKLVEAHGAHGAHEEATRRWKALSGTEAGIFAYNVHLATAELAGVSVDNPKAKPIGREPPVWFVPYLSRERLSRLGDGAERVARRMFGGEAPGAEPMNRVFTAEGPLPCGLTRRQVECLDWSAKGKSSSDIGVIMGLSHHTVDVHLKRACERLGVASRRQAVLKARELGLI